MNATITMPLSKTTMILKKIAEAKPAQARTSKPVQSAPQGHSVNAEAWMICLIGCSAFLTCCHMLASAYVF